MTSARDCGTGFRPPVLQTLRRFVFWCRRMPPQRSSSSSRTSSQDCSAVTASTRSPWRGRSARSRNPPAQSSSCPRLMRRTSTALATLALRSGKGMATRPTPRLFGARSTRGASKPCTWWIQVRTAPLAMWHGSCRPARMALCLCSSCRVSSCRNLPGSGYRAPRSGLGREGRNLYERSGEGAGSIASNRAARGGHGGLEILVHVGRLLGLSLPYQKSSDVRRAIASALPAAYADADKVPVYTSGPCAQLAAEPPTPPNAGNGTSSIRTFLP